MKDWKEIWPERASPSGQVKKGLTQEEKTEVYIYKAKQIHGSKYTYDSFIFKGAKVHALVTCPSCGDFSMTPDNHINGGKGCGKCAVYRPKTEFDISRGHPDRYEYLDISNSTTIRVKCRKHDIEFSIAVSAHCKGNGGCPACKAEAISNAKKYTLEDFEKLARQIHGNRYSYLSYNGSHAPAKIECIEHGIFEQAATNHLAGKGCPLCAHKVYGILYLLKLSEGTYKIGITNNLSKRINELKLTTPLEYCIELIKYWEVDNTMEVEQYLLKKYNNRPELKSTFNGYTELRILTKEEVAEICSFLETI